jgi:hypothetical protein
VLTFFQGHADIQYLEIIETKNENSKRLAKKRIFLQQNANLMEICPLIPVSFRLKGPFNQIIFS